MDLPERMNERTSTPRRAQTQTTRVARQYRCGLVKRGRVYGTRTRTLDRNGGTPTTQWGEKGRGAQRGPCTSRIVFVQIVAIATARVRRCMYTQLFTRFTQQYTAYMYTHFGIMGSN